MESKLKLIGAVDFPGFTGERAYMVPITRNKPLPAKYSRWQKTVDTLLDDIDVEDDIYMTIDQKTVNKGIMHRRCGLHIDGNYSKTNGWDNPPSWITDNCIGGGIILASDEIGCKAYEGVFKGLPKEGGDCSHINLSNAKTTVLLPGQGYLGNSALIHETLPAKENQDRTFIRLTLPETFRYAA